MPDICILVPNLGIETSGNSVTADRYKSIFKELGYATSITDSPTSDVVVALNAYRTSTAVAALQPGTTVVAVITGTDLYRFWETDRETVESTLRRASVVVGLNDQVGNRLPQDLHSKLRIIKEGAVPLPQARPKRSSTSVRAIAVGHLRDEKDPELLLKALNQLPPECSMHVDHYGAAHTSEWATWARERSSNSSRYQWHGEISRSELCHIYAASDLLINTSRLEGGANVISEAVMAGFPIVATAIDGNVGVLGADYPGLVAAQNSPALAQRLIDADIDQGFLPVLADASRALQSELSVEHETEQWRLVLDELTR